MARFTVWALGVLLLTAGKSLAFSVLLAYRHASLLGLRDATASTVVDRPG